MATPHADRLHKMEAWRTSAMEDSHRHLTAVSQALVEIAAGNREVAADLGLEGATGQAARASFDRLARRMIKASDRLKQIVKASTEALTAGIDARNESIEIQTKLKDVNDGFQRAEKVRQASGGGSSVPGMGMTAAEIEAKRQAAHAKIDALAKKSLSKLNGRILAAIDTLPPDGRTGQTTAHAGSRGTRPDGGQTDNEPTTAPAAGPARSATAWAASVDTSLGAPGRHRTEDTGPRQATAASRVVRSAGACRCRARTTPRRPPARPPRQTRPSAPPGIRPRCSTRSPRPQPSAEAPLSPATGPTKQPVRCRRPPIVRLPCAQRERPQPPRPARPASCAEPPPPPAHKQRQQARQPLGVRPAVCGEGPPESPDPPQPTTQPAPRASCGAQPPPCANPQPQRLQPGSPADAPPHEERALVRRRASSPADAHQPAHPKAPAPPKRPAHPRAEPVHRAGARPLAAPQPAPGPPSPARAKLGSAADRPRGPCTT